LESLPSGAGTSIGDEVTICAGAVVECCTIGDGSTVGAGAVLRGVKVGKSCYIDAGAVVPRGSDVRDGSLWSGAPAVQLRGTTPLEASHMRTAALLMTRQAVLHAAQALKSPEELEDEYEAHLQRLQDAMDPDPEHDPFAPVDPDVIRYYQLTQHDPEPLANGMLLRKREYDNAAEAAAADAEEAAADEAEERRFDSAARARRVGDTLRRLSEANPRQPGVVSRIVSDLRSRDPDGAQWLLSLMRDVRTHGAAAAAATAALPAPASASPTSPAQGQGTPVVGGPSALASASGASEEARRKVIAQVRALDFSIHYADDAEAAAAAAAMVAKLAAIPPVLLEPTKA
jgi:hypothetical protein